MIVTSDITKAYFNPGFFVCGSEGFCVEDLQECVCTMSIVLLPDGHLHD